MSATFSGFSEEDIRKLKSGQTLQQAKTTKLIKSQKREIKSNLKSNKNIVLQNTPIYEVPETAKLNIINENKDVKPPEDLTNKNIIEISNSELKKVTLDPSKIEKRVIDLDEFQARQKLIEEQNRKRKELLAKALADRTKRTEEEARKLKEIQNEFKKLDAILSNDVSILRHQIEVASLEFMEAQKKYHRIEKEFLDAKLALHQKLERKEMLTEHLCAIIEKNEERKAEKLSELMSRLDVDAKTVDNPDMKEGETEEKVNGKDNLIDEVKNRREVKIDLNPEKNTETTVNQNGSGE